MKKLITFALTLYGLTHVITQEHGPFAIFSRLRQALAPDFPLEPEPPADSANEQAWRVYQQAMGEYQAELAGFEVEFYTTWQGYGYALVSCPICLGLYLAFVVSLLPDFVLEILAGYGLHLIILKRIN